MIPERCARCVRPMVPQVQWYAGRRPEGHVRHGARRYCAGCYDSNEPPYPEPRFKRADMSWQADARCAGIDVEIFYPNRGRSTNVAKRICAGCPVRDRCLAYALEVRELHGIWGGLSERERRRLIQGRVA